MKKRITSMLIALALIILLAGLLYAESKNIFANGTATEYNQDNANDGDYIFGGKEDDSCASTKITISGALSPYEVYGGGNVPLSEPTKAASVTGDTQIIYNSSATMMGFMYGGGYQQSDVASYDANVGGNTSITFNSGGMEHGAHIMIAGGGCSLFDEPVSSKVSGNTTIVFNNCVISNAHIDPEFGGGYILGGGVAGGASSDASIGGNTNIIINGGVDAAFSNVYIYGGGSGSGESGNADVKGDSNITIAGASGLSMIKGVLAFSGGGKSSAHVGGDEEMSAPAVKGTKSLIFSSVGKGTVSAGIKDFDVIVLKGNDTELTFTKALSSDVKKIKVTGSFASDTAVLTLAADSFKPAVDTTGTAAEWNGMKLIVKGTTKEEPAKPAEPVFDDETQKILSGDVETLAPSVPVTTAAAAALLTETGLTASDMDTDGAGQPILKSEAVQKANTTVQTVYALPIFSAALPAGTTAKIVSCAFEVTGDKLLAATPEAVKLIKVQGAEKSVFFNYSADPADFKTDGTFTIQNAANAIVAATETISADAKYKVTVFIEDNGAYDLDATAGRIVDPSALVTTSAAPEPSGSGSSGGCSSGAFALAALFGCAIVVLKGKR